MYANRDEGLGPVNIDTQIVPDKDIYTLLFASCFRTEIIDKNRWEAKIKKEAYEDRIMKYKNDKRKTAPYELHLELWE